MRKLMNRTNVAIVASAGLVLGACGSGDDDTDPGTTSTDESADGSVADLPTVVVTTNLLGDVVTEALGDAAEVVTIMPVGADPHGFQASAREVDVIMGADALIVNGGDLEESLLDVIESAEADGIPTFEALNAVDTIELGEVGHEDEDHDDDHDGDEDHDDDHDPDEDHDGDEDHDHSGDDPHFWTDPMQMANAVGGIVAFLQDAVEFADPAAVDASADAYVAELTALNDEIEAMIAEVPEDGRKLVTNHAAYGYFAAAYGFEQIGAVIPSGSTVDGTSGGELAELVELVEAEGVPAVFSDNTASDELIQVLAEEADGVEVVELLSGSLTDPGTEGDTYLDMQRVNAERITGALR